MEEDTDNTITQRVWRAGTGVNVITLEKTFREKNMINEGDEVKMKLVNVRRKGVWKEATTVDIEYLKERGHP